jgi:hypothetical protein
MDSDNIKKAGDILEHLLGKEKAGEAGRYYSFFSRWDQIVGPELSGHSKPRDIEKGVLIVETDHPGWIQMFQMSKERILRKVREEYPELGIKNMRIILGNPAEKEREAKREEVEHSEASDAPDSSTEASEYRGGNQGSEQEEYDSRKDRLYSELEKLRRRVEERSEERSEKGNEEENNSS